MNLGTFVIVGNITNLSDARYCAGMGVDMLGFCVDPAAEDFIHPDTIKEIIGWVAGPKFIADYGNLTLDGIDQISASLDLDAIQVNNADIANKLAESGEVVILKLDIESTKDLDQLKSTFHPNINYLYLSCDNVSLADQISASVEAANIDIPVLKGFALSAANVNAVKENSPFTGIVLKGSHEEKPGYKDYEELADILEALEED